MKNTQNGFALISLLIILAVLVVAGGTYIYTKKVKEKALVIENLSEENLPNDTSEKDEEKTKGTINEQTIQSTNPDVVSRLCSQEIKVGNIVNVYSSTNGEYYALNYSYRVFGDPKDMEGNSKILINPVLDNPSAYYNSLGDLVGSCGGLLNQQDSSFCTEILPSLSFDTNDICR